MAARCRKFVPNLFNKTKCQSCFGAKEAHTAAALESSKAARKISKCAYLFVSPDLDFSNPLHRTKRWQRRFFILYDDGELTYSLDDNPGTIPQGSVDMNKCTDVFDAEEKTGHEYSIGITVPSHPTSYVKGTSKDEIRRWFDVLVMYPRSLTIKVKRNPGSKSGGGGLSRHPSYYPSATEKYMSDDEDADSAHSKDSGDTYERSGRTRGRYKQRDLRRCKSEVRPSDLKLAEDEYNKKTPSADGRSALAPLSLPSTSHQQSKFFKDKNIDGLPTRRAGEPETFSSVRSMKHRKAAKNQAVLHQSATEANKAATSAVPPASHPGVESGVGKQGSGASDSASSTPPLNRRLSNPNMPAGPKLTEHKSLSRTPSASTVGGAAGGAFSAFVYPSSAPAPTSAMIDANETDENKIAKNEHARKSMEKSPIVRKGWLLVKQDAQTNVWSKHWFVLCGTALSYYKDARAEETGQLDGSIDVDSAYEVSSIKAERNHGFRIKTKEGEYVLSAMTSGIRRNWIEAVESIIAEIRRAKEKSAKQDMGFVFESPLRSPRVNSTAPAPPPATLTPVVPDSGSRVNNALREMAERRRETGDDRPLEELYDVVPPSADGKDSACSDTEREVSVLTANQDVTDSSLAAAQTNRQPTDPLQPPKSPSAFVSPSQRIKEKSRAKTPPRTRSPPPPSPIPAVSSVQHNTSKTPTPVDRILLLPPGSSSDENDDSLTAKLLESQKQVQHLQQQVQDVNSMVRKQRVEIESLQTKLELTTSQLRDMETAITHSAQNLNKERKNSNKLTEALESLRRSQMDSNSGEHQEKCVRLERQLHEATHKLSSQEAKSNDEQLQIRTSKLATLEKVLGNTRRHLQDAVENVRETELHYQTKIEELEHDYEDERVDLQQKLQKMEERLHKLVTESNNSVNADLSGQLMKEKSQSVQRLDELVKEQKGKIDQLTEDNAAARQQIEDLQCYKDRAAVSQSQLDSVQQEFNSLHITVQALQANLEAAAAELTTKDNELVAKCQENTRLLASIAELKDKYQSVQETRLTHSDAAQDYENEREMLRVELESVTLELNNALESSRSEIDSLRQAHSELSSKLQDSAAQVQALEAVRRNLELELKREKSKPVAVSLPPPAQPSATQGAPASSEGGYTLSQVVDLINAVVRSCERMTESTVAMLAGEMIETDIKATVNFNQEQRLKLGNKTVEQLLKKFSGIRQRLNYVVKNSVTKKQLERLQTEKDALAEQLSDVKTSAGSSTSQQADSTKTSSHNNQDYLSALLERCRAEILCISTDITRIDISHIETKLQSLNTILQQLDEQKSVEHFSRDSTLNSYCNKLAVQAAAMFELARTLSTGVEISTVLSSVENCLQSTSGVVTSIEDLSLRNYALLVCERLLLSYELDQLISNGHWKGTCDKQSTKDFTTRSLVAETLQRIDMFSMSEGRPLGESCLNSCLSSLLQQNIAGRPSLDMLRNESTLIATLFKNVDVSLTNCISEYCSQYTTELVNFGSVEISEVKPLLTSITSSMCRQIKQLTATGHLSELSLEWLHEQLCTVCEKIKGLEPKDMPNELLELSLKMCMLESKFNMSSSLILKRETSTLSQSLVSEASKLAGLSSELARKAAAPDSTEAKIASLAYRLEHTDRLLSAYTGHYGDTVQQVMREVVNSLQMSILRYQIDAGVYPASPTEQSLTHQVQQLSLQLRQSNQRANKLVNADQHEKAVEALHDEMFLLKVEHSSELDESKRDMKMVLKSVKAEEYRLATELTEHISRLKSHLADEKRAHQATTQKLEDTRPDTVPLEEHALLKDKVRDLENCLHEMQEEFEEELYQERRSHLAELDKTRAELLEVVTKAGEEQLTAGDIKQQYDTVIVKLKAEQASLQQWIDDIREAHRDEIDALQHERDAALADEVMATQSALEAMQSAHAAEVEEERGRMKEQQEKASQLLQVERDLLLQKHENEIKEKRIASLESKICTDTRKLAKLELNSSKNNDIIAELTNLNHKIAERNNQLVNKFSQELGRSDTASAPGADGQHMALKARVEGLNEELQLARLGKRQLEEKLGVMQAGYEQQLREKEEEAKLEAAVTASPSEEVLRIRQLRGRSSSPHTRRSSPPVLALSPSQSRSSSVSSSVEESAPPASKATASPQRPPARSYDLGRSKSTPSMDKQPMVPRSKRLSNPDEQPARPPAVLDTNDRGFQRYQKSGGIPLADRMRKFT